MHLLLTSESQQQALGARLGQALQLINDGFVIFLQGDLGAGKTTLARGVLRALGWTGSVKSPTYTLMEIYDLDQRQLCHLDLYRLAAIEELDFLGLRDVEADSILLIEWPEAFAAALPEPDLTIAITHADNGRRLELHAHSTAAATVLERLQPI
jgi:tRNA threonylcarbamoyladenosine biosynthesis protein TsaE